jgi:hypothetical protein
LKINIFISKIRTFRHTLHGLPFETYSTSISSSPPSASLLTYQIYALSVLCDQSNGTIRTTSTTTPPSLQTNLPLSIHPTYPLSDSTETEQKKSCFTRHRYQCICILVLILILFLIAIFILIITSNFGIRLSSCHCPNGYERSSSTTSCTCIDRNECFNGAGYHTCTGLNMQCINTMGSYVCRCRPGFTREKDKDSCIDINECDLYKPCNTSLSTCINLPGRYYCQCLMNQTSDEQCIPINICTEKKNLCGPHSECVPSSSNGYNCRV